MADINEDPTPVDPNTDPQAEDFIPSEIASGFYDNTPVSELQALDLQEIPPVEEPVPLSDINTSPADIEPYSGISPAYDDDGFLLPGYSLDEDNNPIFVGSTFVEPATQAQADADREFAFRNQARQQQTIAQQRRQINNGDWRVRLRLAPQSRYLYNAPNPGILQPLQVTDGIIFPYTPKMDTVYKANYDSYDLTHSNYKGYFYKGSSVEAISLKATFTAQSTAEANYLLATIHFLRSVTKMFYGQDAERGAPPPLVYLSGFGDYQFNEHPCLVQSFNYDLPDNVDYVRAGSPNQVGLNLVNQRDRQSVSTNSLFGSLNRLAAAFLTKGAVSNPLAPATLGLNRPTYVPTKTDINITLLPVQSRQQVSKQFSVKEFANGNLIRGGFW